ncbi:MAG: type II toxin-antitoxin system VapC family toxin [Saprospiraceae bacterium]
MASTKIYLDTSVINFLFADDSPEHQAETREFFDTYIRLGIYETFVSVFVVDELNQTKQGEKREKLLNVIADYELGLLEVTDPEIVRLAQAYLATGVMPPKKLYDALHVAAAVFHRIDYLVSWNYKHLANVNRESRVNAVNLSNGYIKPVRILTPLELMSDET